MLKPVPSSLVCDSLRSAEGRLLGWVLSGLDPSPVLGEVAPSDFTMPGNRLLCGLLAKRWGAGAPVDSASVMDALMESDPEEIVPKLGGWDGFTEWTGALADTLKPDALAALVRLVKRAGNGERTRRALPAWDAALASGDFEAARHARGALQSHMDEAERLDGKGSGAPIFEEPAAVWGRALGQISDDMRAKDGPLGIRFGIPGLDSTLHPGMRPGRLWVIGAGTAEGKTCLALQAALRAARRGHGVLYLSLEMPPEELHERAAAMETAVEAWKIQKRQLSGTADQTALLGWEPPAALLAPLVPGLKARQIPGLVKEARRRLGAMGQRLALLVVDHLQLVQSGERPESRALEVKAAANLCKEIALGAGGGEPLAVLALSQLRRARDKARPDLGDLKESGGIEEAADVVLLLTRKRDGEGMMLSAGEIFIGKNRGGAAHGKEPVTFDRDRLRFE